MKWNDIRTCFLLCLVAGLFDFGIIFIGLSNGLILLWFLAGMIVLFYYGDN